MEQEYRIENLIKIIIVMVLIVGIFYGLTILITKKQNNLTDNGTNENVEIKYDEILIGSIYDQKEAEYYVLVELESDYLTLSSVVSNYTSKKDSLKLYTCDLNDGLNKKYLGDTSDFTKQYPIFSKSSLLKISNKQIVEYTEGTDDIQKKLS